MIQLDRKSLIDSGKKRPTKPHFFGQQQSILLGIYKKYEKCDELSIVSFRPLAYPLTNVFLVCFCVISPTSFSNVKDKWIAEIRRECPSAPIILVATQIDRREQCKRIYMKYFHGIAPLILQFQMEVCKNWSNKYTHDI